MKCAIQGLQIADQLERNSINIDPKYFVTDAFLERFGEWRSDKISEEQLKENKQDSLRFNEDGSPKLYSHENESELSYYNNTRTRIPIIRQYYKTLPVELRSTLPAKAVKTIIANILLSPELSGEIFESGDSINFDLSSFYDEQVLALQDEYGASDMILDSLEDDKSDYMEAIVLQLRALGVHYAEADVEIDANGNEAIKQPPSVQRDPLDRASAVIKSIVEFIPQRDVNGNLVATRHLGNAPVMMNRSYVWYKILDHMANLAFSRDGDVTEQFIAHLSKLAKKEPWVSTLVDSLKNGDEDLKLAFVAATNNVKNVLFNTEYDVNTGFITRDAVNLNTNTNNIAKSWAASVESTIKADPKYVEKIEYTLTGITLALKDMKIARSRNSVQSTLTELQTTIAPIFDIIGVKMPSSITHIAFKEYQKEKHAGLTEVQLQATNDVMDIQSFKNFLISSVETLATMGKLTEEGKSGALINHFKPYLEASKSVDMEEAGNHMVTAGKNRLYVYSLPSILQETLMDWKANPSVIATYLKIPGAKNSQFLKRLNDPQAISDLRLGMKGVLHIEGRGRKNADTKDIKAGDYAKVDFNNVLRVVGAHRKRKPIYSTQLAADKGQEMQFEGMGFNNTVVLDENGVFNSVASVEAAAQDIFVPYVIDEYDNMLRAKGDISEALQKVLDKAPQSTKDLIKMSAETDITTAFTNAANTATSTELKEIAKVVDEASNELVMFYHLDTKGRLMNLTTGDPNIGSFLGGAFEFKIPHTMNDVDGIFAPNNLPGLDNSGLLTLDDTLRNKIETVVEEALQAKIGEFTLKARRVYNLTAASNNISADVKQAYRESGHNSDTNIELQMYHDYIVNSMMAKIEYSKLFTGPLQFYKHNGDYIKRVPSTYADGLMMATSKMNKSFRQMTFATEGMLDSPLNGSNNTSKSRDGWQADEVPVEVREYYKFVDRTDAQGWITADRWADIMKGIGKFNSKAREVHRKLKEQWKYVENNTDVPAELLLTKDEIKTLSAQPLKGVFFNYEIGGTPQYIKYSQAVLIPSFINNNPKAKQLAAYMAKHNIDEAIADTGVKVGARRPNQLFTKEGLINDIDKPYIAELPNANWRLQQDLPTKTMKDTKVGIQVQKIVMSALAFTGDTNRRDQIQQALSDLSDAGLAKLFKKYGLKDDNLIITNPDKFYKALLDDLLKKEIPEDNLIRAIKAHTDISLLPSMKDKMMSGIMSTIKKAATDLMTNGGAMIQISDQLIGKTDVLSKGITMLVDDLDRLQPPLLEWKINEKGERVQRVKSGQVLIPHKMIATLVPDYATKSPAELREILTPEALQLIGYRIPTQAKASVDALEIVGILPEEMGDSIITYAEITAKTGSDFDIDKMFLIVPDLIRKTSYAKSSFDYKGVKVSYNDKLLTADTKVPVAAQTTYHKDGSTSIRLNEKLLRESYKNRAWETPRTLIETIDGKEVQSKMDPLPDNLFETYEDFKQFVLEHEFQHTLYRREQFNTDTQGHGTSGQYESAINSLAIKAIRELGSNPIKDNRVLGKVVKDRQGLAAKRNNLFDLFYQTINDPKHYSEMMTSIDNDTFKIGTLSMIDNSRGEQAYDVFDPIQVITQRFAFRLGAAGVGMAANGHSDHILTQGMAVKFFAQQGKWGNPNMDAQYSEALSNDDLDMLVDHINGYLEITAKKNKSTFEPLSQQKIDGLRSINIGGTLSELINAFVDIANEQAFVARGNWSALFNDYGMSMIRSGVHPHKVSAILAQPVLRKLAEDISNKEGIIENTSSKDIEADLLKSLVKRLQDLTDNKFDKDLLKSIKNAKSLLGEAFTFADLLQNVRAKNVLNLDLDSTIKQIKILKHYMQTKGAVRKYGNFVLGAKVDAKGAGRSLAEMLVTMNRVSDSLEYDEEEGGIAYGFYKYYNDHGVPTQTMKMYENTVGFTLAFMESNSKMFNGMSLSKLEQFQAMAAASRNNPRLLEKTASEFIFKAYDLYKLSGFTPLTKETSEAETEVLRAKVAALKKAGNHAILNKLLVDSKGEYFVDSASRKDVDLKNQMTDSWRSLLQTDKEVGDFLVREAYRISNFRPGPKQFHELIPFEWYSNNRYEEYSKDDIDLTDEFVKFSLNLDISDLNFFKYIKNAVSVKDFTITRKDGTVDTKKVNYSIVSLTQDSLGLGGIQGFLPKNKSLNRPPKYASINATMAGKITQIVKNPKTKAYFAVYSDLNGQPVLNSMIPSLFIGQKVEVTSDLREELIRETPKFVDLAEQAAIKAVANNNRESNLSSAMDDLNCKIG